jgi:hypothetical protein
MTSIKAVAIGLVLSLSTLLVGCDLDKPIGGSSYTGSEQTTIDQPKEGQVIDTTDGINSYEANYCRNAADEEACLQGVEGANDRY